jgi:hypothetical protein
MSKFSNPLNNVKIASPCSADWNAMIGDDRTRFCGQCKLNVFNLSGMTCTEAESLIMNSEGRLCVRFYARPDGSVITQDCPVGWARIKKRAQLIVTAAASLVFSFLGALGMNAMVTRGREFGSNLGIPVTTPTPTPLMGMPRPIMGDVSEPLMGKIAASTPSPTPTPQPQIKMGEMVAVPTPTPAPKRKNKRVRHQKSLSEVIVEQNRVESEINQTNVSMGGIALAPRQN